MQHQLVAGRACRLGLLRKALGVDLIIGTTDLHLDASIMLTDVQLFSEALAHLRNRHAGFLGEFRVESLTVLLEARQDFVQGRPQWKGQPL